MIDLITNDEREEIREALANALFTYSKTPIKLITKGVSLDRYNEDRNDITETIYDFDAFVEYKNGDKVKNGSNLGGAWDNADVKVMITIEQMELAGLIVDGSPTVNATTSNLDINGENFETVHVSLEGAFEQRQVAVYIWGQRNERYAG